MTVLVSPPLPHAARPSAESAATAVVIMGSRMRDISCLLLVMEDI